MSTEQNHAVVAEVLARARVLVAAVVVAAARIGEANGIVGAGVGVVDPNNISLFLANSGIRKYIRPVLVLLY